MTNRFEVASQILAPCFFAFFVVKKMPVTALKNAIRKDRYLSPDDAKLINDFITKLKKELSSSN